MKKVKVEKSKTNHLLKKSNSINEEEWIDKDTKEFYDKYKEKITCAYSHNISQDSQGVERCYAKRTEEREKYLFRGLTEEMVLIECPPDMLAIEFETHNREPKGSQDYKEVSKDQIKKWIGQVCENARSNKIEFCVCDHGGTSPWFYACNFENLIENRNNECKREIANIIIPSEASDFLDLSNLGKTLVPIINRPHWKKIKYSGSVHKIVEGKHPLKHKNKVPNIVLQRVFDSIKPKNSPKKDYGDTDINSLSITSIISMSGLKKRGKEYQGSNVWHGSSSGSNFCVNTITNEWFCFRCNSGGSISEAIALNKGIIRTCDQKLTPDQFKEVLEIARNEYGLKRPEPKEIIKDLAGSFIFDSSKVVNPAVFSCHKIGDSFGYGLLIPKEVPVFDKNNKVVARKQIRSPAIITSEREIIEPNPETESKFKIRYIAIPNELDLRIETEVLESFLKGQTPTIKGEELFNEIKKEGYEKFLFFHNPLWYDIHTLWDIGTYFFELFNAFPILEMRGLSGSAKSKVMKVSSLFTLNPTGIMINPSEASLFRVTHTKRPTKYIDEAEKLFVFIGGQFQSSPVVELINGSYAKGSSVPRLEKMGNDYRLVSYGCYSPTMVGSIAGLRDATETRAITHIMTKSPDSDKRGELEVEDYSEDRLYQEIRNKLYLFAWSNWRLVDKTYKEIEITTLKKRDLQLWKPLLAIAKTINEGLFDRVLKFAEKVSKQRKEDFIPEGSTNYQLLKIVGGLLESGRDIVYLNDIAELYNRGKEKKTSNKTISTHLDKLGFLEYREKDTIGSHLRINQSIYDTIVNPICPNLSSYSSYSSSNRIKEEKNDDEHLTNDDEHGKEVMTNMTNNDENDEYYKSSVSKIKNTFNKTNGVSYSNFGLISRVPPNYQLLTKPSLQSIKYPQTDSQDIDTYCVNCENFLPKDMLNEKKLCPNCSVEKV